MKKEKTTITPVDTVEKKLAVNLLFSLLVEEDKLFIRYKQFKIFKINSLIYFINNYEVMLSFENFN